jgi:hypothetical protein
MSRHFWQVLGVGWLAVAASPAFAAEPRGENNQAAAQQVRAALKAELAGQAAQRAELLEIARSRSPAYAPAYWHAGYVRAGKHWVTVEEAQRQGAADKRLDEYSLQRGIAGETAGEQLALAMWCRGKGLAEQERLHLMKTLQLDPKNAEAARRLGVRWVNGEWLTAEEAAAQQEADRTAARQWNKWNPLVRGWRDAIDGKDAGRREAALKALRAVTDPGAIPALEKLLSAHSEDLALEVVAVLGKMPQQEATESLVRHAVVSRWTSVSESACEQLKPRDLYSYVPALLSGMAMPIELNVGIHGDTAAVSFFQETQDAKYHIIRGQTICRYINFQSYAEAAHVDRMMRVTPRVRYWLDVLDHTVESQRDSHFSGRSTTVQTGPTPADVAKLRQNAAEWRRRVDNANSYTQAANRRIATVLGRTTEPLDTSLKPTVEAQSGSSTKSYPTDPRFWWGWWAQFNEMHAPEKPHRTDYYHQTVTYSAYVSSQRTLNSGTSKMEYTTPPPSNYNYSCFPLGTPVWTERGLTNIEQIRPGDRVLSQDQDSGELKFQSVVAATLRPESPLVKIRHGSGTISATRGHPFWVAGHGWRMAKNVKPGDLLHGLRGPVRVETVEEDKDQRAYNLVVDGFNTYFVGQTGLLVHDNVIRTPTACVLPGLKKSELAAAD